MGSDSPQRILHAGPDLIRETFGVRHPSFELAPSRCALERVPRIDTKYPANERHHDRSLPATGPGGSASRGDSGAALSVKGSIDGIVQMQRDDKCRIRL